MVTEIELTNMSNCKRCTSCRWMPSMTSTEFAEICPSIRHGRFQSYSGGGKMITGYALSHGLIPYDEPLLDTVYACSACGGCDVACKASFDDLIEPGDGIYALRAKVVEDGQLPESLRAVLAKLRARHEGTASDATPSGQWCATSPRVIGPDGKSADHLLLVGDLAYDRDQWAGLHHIVSLLETSAVDFSIGGSAERDAGGLAFEIGDRVLAQQMGRSFADMVLASGARVLLIADDHLFATIRSLLPRLGITLGGVEVRHITQWLAETLPLAANGAGSAGTVAYHDSCRLGRLSDPYVPWSGQHDLALTAVRVRDEAAPTRMGSGGVYDAPRTVLAAAGFDLLEMPRNKERSFCCGLGAGASDFSPAFARSAAQHRLEEAISTGASRLVTSCGGCAGHLREVAESAGLPIAVNSLAELLTEDSSHGN